MIAFVVAHDPNFLIGSQNGLPWHCPEDLALFKEMTLNQKIVMGRKTMESIQKVLPKRFTYILTNNKNYRFDHPNVEVIHDITQLISRYENSEDTLFVCGGAEIYRLFLPYCKVIYASVMKKTFEGDTYLIDYTKTGFVEELETEYNDFYFKVFERNEK